MEDNKKVDDSAAIRLNEETVRKLATIVSEKHLSLFEADLAEAISKARTEIDEKKAKLALMGTTPNTSKLSQEQQAELFVTQMCRRVGFDREIDVALDVDGVITQALGPGTASKGGFLVPEDWIAEINKRANEPAVVWPIITKRPTRRDSVVKPTVTGYVSTNRGAAAKSGSTTSSDTIAETEPTFSELTWTMRYFDAYWQTKLDLLDDSALNIMQELTEIVADAFSIRRESEPLIGTGAAASRPTGLFNSSITHVAVGALTLTTILAFVSNIPQRYRSVSQILMSATNFFTLAQQLAENVRAAQYLVNVLPPWKESAFVSDDCIIGGDFRRYVVYHNRLMHVVSATKPSNYTLETAIVEKWDGVCTIPDAFRIGTITSPYTCTVDPGA